MILLTLVYLSILFSPIHIVIKRHAERIVGTIKNSNVDSNEKILDISTGDPYLSSNNCSYICVCSHWLVPDPPGVGDSVLADPKIEEPIMKFKYCPPHSSSFGFINPIVIAKTALKFTNWGSILQKINSNVNPKFLNIRRELVLILTKVYWKEAAFTLESLETTNGFISEILTTDLINSDWALLENENTPIKIAEITLLKKPIETKINMMVDSAVPENNTSL